MALIRPLIDNNFIDKSATLNINAVSGYTGGGKKLIEYFSNQDKETFVYYSTFLDHKHLKEIKRYGLLTKNPIFCPSVGAFPQGMAVSLPLHFDWMKEGINGRKIHAIFEERYRSEEFVSINKVFELCSNITGSNLKPIYKKDRPLEVKEATCSANKARKLLNLSLIHI